MIDRLIDFNSKAASKIRRKALQFDILESRCVPAVIQWIGPNDGSWNTRAYWSGGLVPGEQIGRRDEVTVSGIVDIIQAPVQALASLTVSASSRLVMGNVQLNVDGATIVSGQVEVSGTGVLSSTSIEVRGSGGKLIVGARALASAGSISIQAGGTIDLRGGTLGVGLGGMTILAAPLLPRPL